MSTIVLGPDGEPRCAWSAATPAFLSYHDTEWGFPVGDDVRLFEKLSLEGFQSGLSWRTILAKRDNFRAAFKGFDLDRVAKFGERDITRLLQDEGIVRNRGKIKAVINNARRAKELIERDGSLAAFIWRFEPSTEQPASQHTASTSRESEALSSDLKKQGWQFVGPTTVYAFMQAMGLVNDHVEGCVVRARAERERQLFKRPA
ncbi:MAG TPA: DNA-3-methyladenine glycosylase I [Solirubrobacteraceae bacterium]|nr:DNA-3-methyladenine glycosylase I [Solirubrobacteraceae bacterium]